MKCAVLEWVVLALRNQSVILESGTHRVGQQAFRKGFGKNGPIQIHVRVGSDAGQF